MITLIHKYAATTFIEQLKHHVNDAWGLVSYARIPIYLETSSAQLISFTAFLNLLEQAQTKLPTLSFIALVQKSADNFIDKILSDTRQSPSLQRLAELIPVNAITVMPNVDGYSVELEIQQQGQSLFLAELYLLVVTHSYRRALYSDLSTPVKYHLTHPNVVDLEQLKVNNQTPQFLGQQRTALFYDKAISPILGIDDVSPARFDQTALSYSKQVSTVLEGYTGRETLSIEELSLIIEVNERTIQRRLKSEGTTFRKIKETSNMAFAKRVMVQRSASISDVAEHLGYADTSQFIRAFKRAESTTPLQWLKQAEQSSTS
ncbi:helix-turn-helix transcriptional regulator [Vibrio coralliirubri]|uniref:helix-turn-helix transcriptional regulator n=1 Tax=Vibrio coralliirubri TaxID=1516159 RepID=UPI00063771F2|nr:AraC family transcriptional regulator [Vibrio coralliirubri]CDT25243.1 conserved hypothetical protein [Vibrio coralliirubri]